MHIVFENPGELDLNALRTFGVSVKEGDSPIGFFGTGLKYAMAILMRHHQSMSIQIGEECLTVGVEDMTIRGKSFQIITLNDQRQAFTTDLGKTWPMWAAYRELYSNAIDEGGKVFSTPDWPKPLPGVTQIIVSGSQIEETFLNRREYFLDTTPFTSFDGLHFHRNITARPGVFVKGIRVGDVPRDKISLFTYSFDHLTLTEDRTTASDFEVTYELRKRLLGITDESTLRNLLTVGTDYIEYNLSIGRAQISSVCEKVLGDLSQSRSTQISLTGRRLLSEITPFVPQATNLNKIQQMQLDKAVRFCVKLGYEVNAYPIVVVGSLGSGVLGRAESGTIQVALEAFNLGTKMVAATVLEEYIHLSKGHPDYTVEMQNYLFHQLIGLGERLVEEPL